MAVWQIPIKLISARECAIDWKNLIKTEALSATLPEEKSWCGHIKQYGALDSTCVEVFAPRIQLRRFPPELTCGMRQKSSWRAFVLLRLPMDCVLFTRTSAMFRALKVFA